jgi:hypothetical protein
MHDTSDPGMDDLQSLFAREYRAIDALLRASAAAVEAGDEVRARAAIDLAQRAVVLQLAMEDHQVLPSLVAHDAARAHTMRVEHEHLREQLGALRHAAAHGGVLRGAIDRVIGAYREHTRHEETTLSLMADVGLPPHLRAELRIRTRDRVAELQARTRALPQRRAA